MPRTSRINYGQCLVLGSPRPANQSNVSNLTGMKRIQSAAVDYSFNRQRFKQIGSPNFVGDVNITNPEINFESQYYYTNGTNELLLGLNVDGRLGTALSGLNRPNQDNNFYILFNSGVNDDVLLEDTDATFKDNYNVMGLGNCFLNSYQISASVGNLVTVNTSVQADNINLQKYSDSTNGEAIPAVDQATKQPSATNKYKLSTSSFKNTTNQDGLIESAFAPSGIKLTMPTNFNVPGLELSGAYGEAIINSFNMSFNIERYALYGFGSIYPFGRRALLPVLGEISFGALATEFQSGALANLVRLDHNEEVPFDFTIDVLSRSGTTGLQIEVEGAKVDNQSFAESIGDNASFDLGLSFSISNVSGLRLSTPPLILSQPVSSSGPLNVVATGRSPFTYQWYHDGDSTGPNASSYTATADGDYYCIISNDLGSATSNTAAVDLP